MSLDGKWFVETNYNANNCVRNAVTILEKAGISSYVERYSVSKKLVKIEFRM